MRRKSKRRIVLLVLLLLVFYGVMYRGFGNGSTVDPVLIDGHTLYIKDCSYIAFRLRTTVQIGAPQPSYDLASAIACPTHM